MGVFADVPKLRSHTGLRGANSMAGVLINWDKFACRDTHKEHLVMREAEIVVMSL